MYQWGSNAQGCRMEALGISSTAGTSVSSGISNAMGSFATIGTTSFDYELIFVSLLGSAANDYVVDLYRSDGSNTAPVATGLRVRPFAASEHLNHYAIPVHVPAGSQLQARAQCSAGSGSPTVQVAIYGCSMGLRGAPGFSRMEAINSFSSSKGVTVTTSASANTYGSWTTIAATLSHDYQAIIAHLGQGETTTVHLGIGAAASEFGLTDCLMAIAYSVYGQAYRQVSPPLPIFLPSGARLAARAKDTAGGKTVDVTIYGLV